MRVRIAAVFAALLVAGLVAAIPGAQRTHADDQTVSVGNLYFCGPSFEGQVCNTSVTVGDTVTWAHVEGFHTVTECGVNFSSCPKAGGFDSGTLSGGSFQRVFSQAGEYWYECVFHPDQMRGRVVVAALVTPSPTPAPIGEPSAAPQAGAPQSSQTPAPAGIPAAGGSPGPGGETMPVALVAGAALIALAIAVLAVRMVGDRP